MKPNPNSPSYLHDEYNVEDDADDDNPDIDSKSPPSFSSSPRRFLSDEDDMDVGGGSDEEQSTNSSPQGSKRTRQEREESDDQEDILSSTEPVTKKRRTQETAAEAKNTAASSASVSHSSEARDYQYLQQLVNWTCEHVLGMNQGLPYKIGDTFIPNTFDQFRNALEKAIQSNAPELVQKLFETGMHHCVPATLDTALALAESVGAHDVIALLNPSSSSSSTTALPIFSTSEKGWQKKVKLELDVEDIEKITGHLEDQKNPTAVNELLFGEGRTVQTGLKVNFKRIYFILVQRR